MTTTTERVLTTKKGKVVRTNLTDEQAITLLRDVPGNFAADLCRQASRLPNRTERAYGRGGLSADQITWVHALVIDHLAKQNESPVTIGDLAGIVKLFDHARTHLQYPKVRLALADRGIILSVCGERSKFPGSISVCDQDKNYLGRIHLDGRFEASGLGRNATGLVELLQRFAAEPEKVAAEYGKLHGRCCFCGTELTDARSTAVGYGKVCAAHFSMPYGEVKHEFKMPEGELATV